jgi:hypothetical protein
MKGRDLDLPQAAARAIGYDGVCKGSIRNK